MDVNSARYLISALIQATATAWALILAIHFFYSKGFKDMVDHGPLAPANLGKKDKEDWLKKEIKWTGEKFSYFGLSFMVLLALSLFGLLSIIWGIVALGQFDTYSYPLPVVAITVILSLSFFIILFNLIAVLVYGRYTDVRNWKRDRLGVVNMQLNELKKTR